MTFLSVLLLTVLSAAPPGAAAGGRLDHTPWHLAHGRQAVPYMPRILVGRGHGGWRLNQHHSGLTTWCEGLGLAASIGRIGVRLDARDEQIPDISGRGLDAGADVDTTLGELFSDLTPTALNTVP
jgi:hypothetical protein